MSVRGIRDSREYIRHFSPKQYLSKLLRCEIHSNTKPEITVRENEKERKHIISECDGVTKTNISLLLSIIL